MTSRPKLRILCFGDSLTAGYSALGAIHRPYAETLVQMLAMAFPAFDIDAVEDGVSGCTVKHDFMRRMHERFPTGKRKKDDEGFDWTIVLGGTNDLGYGIAPEDIFCKLKEVWDLPLRRKSKVLALTVPESGFQDPRLRERVAARRNKLNELIKGYKRTNFHVFDLHEALPFFAMTEAEQERYWDDALHLTPAGYDLMGNKIGTSLVSILVKENIERANRPVRPRRQFRDDDKVFEEEVGSPASLDQGYVVVRRKDLD